MIREAQEKELQVVSSIKHRLLFPFLGHALKVGEDPRNTNDSSWNLTFHILF